MAARSGTLASGRELAAKTSMPVGGGGGRRFWTQDRAARKLLIESPMVLPHVTSGIIIIFLQTRKARRSVVKLLVRDCNATMG